MRIAVDSNILLYAEGLNDERRRDLAVSLLEMIGPDALVLPLQAMGEVLMALMRKAHRDADYSVGRVRDWLMRYAWQETSEEVFRGALEIVERHKLSIWDSIILSSAHAAEASVLLSEDLQDGFTWKAVTVVNPFTASPESLRRRLSQSVH
jgi:predicted nucleic acid-binding protein